MIEKHVTSLELSKKLKELGFKQDSLFYWQCMMQEGWEITNARDCDAIEEINGVRNRYKMDLLKDNAEDGGEEVCSAYLASELGELLPESLNVNGKDYRFHTRRIKSIITNNWNVWYLSGQVSELHAEYAETEANARAKMLIWLVEQGHLKVIG